MQKSLSFPECLEGKEEEEARDLIRGLLTDMKSRLLCSGIQKHSFFALTDWDHLLSGMQMIVPIPINDQYFCLTSHTPSHSNTLWT